jgi:hypothetical protein
MNAKVILPNGIEVTPAPGKEDTHVITKSGKLMNVNRLVNLKVIGDRTMAQDYNNRSRDSFMKNRENINRLKEEFQLSADTIQEVLAGINIKAVDVMRMSMLDALSKNDYSEAARFAAQLSEYESAKLSRVEQNITNKVEDLSDDELKEILKSEGLSTDD